MLQPFWYVTPDAGEPDFFLSTDTERIAKFEADVCIRQINICEDAISLLNPGPNDVSPNLTLV